MTTRKPQKRSRPTGRTTPGRARPTPRSRRGRLTLVLAGVAVVALAVLLFAVTRTKANGTGSSQGAFVGGDLHSLVVLSDGRVYVGGHDGVTMTRDSGRTWTQVDTLAHADAMGWGVQPRALFVSGHPGLNRSDDNGSTFRRVNNGLPDTDVHSFGAGPDVLYAAGPGLGVVASTDGGDTWEPRSTDAGRAFFGRIIVDPDNDQHLIAADVQAGPVTSRDGARTWQPLGGSPASWLSSPDSASRTLLASGGGAARSTDGGQTWQPLTLPEGAVLVEATPGDARHLYAAGLTGTNARLWVSTDAGATWTAA